MSEPTDVFEAAYRNGYVTGLLVVMKLIDANPTATPVALARLVAARAELPPPPSKALSAVTPTP